MEIQKKKKNDQSVLKQVITDVYLRSRFMVLNPLGRSSEQEGIFLLNTLRRSSRTDSIRCPRLVIITSHDMLKSD